jgi:hypothetical protein
MLGTRKYGPLIVLAFGFLLTTVWIAAITWFPLQLITSAIAQIL